MFFEISKFLRFLLVSPISWMAFLMVVTLWVKRKRGRRILLGVAATVFLVFTNNLLVELCAIPSDAAVCPYSFFARGQDVACSHCDGRLREHEP